ncbi:hypothetical protein [Halostagnicola sp. A-GB9-2]|uniref:hypothetical protein n=1 Tax=Halostagnicola sp. A-GB9-2 TaxID=3048066 RepID=UPI0024C0C20F|nr:hypothetical protein [Halostagnicola sp. A-GB9-2]MDJ1433983.1 hypothetical protein [Halostagnicola sp. A-GB9-2]
MAEYITDVRFGFRDFLLGFAGGYAATYAWDTESTILSGIYLGSLYIFCMVTLKIYSKMAKKIPKYVRRVKKGLSSEDNDEPSNKVYNTQRIQGDSSRKSKPSTRYRFND